MRLKKKKTNKQTKKCNNSHSKSEIRTRGNTSFSILRSLMSPVYIFKTTSEIHLSGAQCTYTCEINSQVKRRVRLGYFNAVGVTTVVWKEEEEKKNSIRYEYQKVSRWDSAAKVSDGSLNALRIRQITFGRPHSGPVG